MSWMKGFAMAQCCEKCFSDGYLLDYIRQNGHVGTCDYCESDNVLCVSTDNMTSLFEPLIALFKPAERETQYTLADRLSDYWNIFADYEYGSETISRLLDEIRPHEVEAGGMFTFSDAARDHESGEDWSIKDEYRDIKLWEDFARGIVSENRFFLKDNSIYDMLREIGDKASAKINVDNVLYRGRIAESNLNIAYYHKEHMFAPPPDKAPAGRANVEGIPVLYASSDKDTIIAEVRAWVGAHITIASMKPRRELHVVDFTNHACFGSPFCQDDLTHTFCLMRLMRELDKAFARPFSSSDGKIHYVPTQYVASYFKNAGYDGIRYRSAMNPTGYNVALFDGEDAVQVGDLIYVKVNRVSYDTSEYVPWFLRPGVKLTLPDPFKKTRK